jgi:serine/threonine protein kinase
VTDRWDRTTALFGAARALDLPVRTGFLEIACADDRDLRAEVEALLAADRDDDTFLAQTPWAAILEALPTKLESVLEGQLLKDRYRVGQQLAAGGQAHVYRATDQLLERPVVIKVMRASAGQQRVLTSRFEQEMKALSRIDHPGVVGILDVGELADGAPYLAIQHVEGMSLREVLQDGPLDPARAAVILQQLGAALGAAHAAGVAHQDLKPENIMVQRLADSAETIKLIDFGIAKVDRSELAPVMTTITIAGTVRYMAPEQFQGENSPACDIYALALVACEMLSGQPDLRAVPASISRRTRRLLESALALRPGDRPSDVRGWAEQVAGALARGHGARRRAAVALAIGALIATASVAGSRTLWMRYGEPVRVVQKVGAYDPVDEGFLTHGDVTGTVAQNAERSGYDGWRLFSSAAGGYYYKKLGNAQKRRALDRGWTLTAVMRLEQGSAFAIVDFAGYGRRFDIELFSEPDAEQTRLLTQILPTLHGLDLWMPRTPGAYHQYELRFDPGLESADLWVDGIKRLGGYRGLTQFQDDMGLFFGAGPYKSDRGIASFQSVRFEVHP